FVVNNVSGSGQLRQLGPGVTTLGTGLSYTGGTLITGGTLVVNDPTALGISALTINGGEFLAGASETHTKALTGSGTSTIAAAHGQTLILTTGLMTLNATTYAFGAHGQDGTVALEAPLGGTLLHNGYTVLVQAGTLRPADGVLLPALLQGDAHTAI